MLSFLGVLTFAAQYNKTSKDELEFSLEMQNKFIVPLRNLSYEDENLLELLFGTARHGANFVTSDAIDFKNYIDKTIKIIQKITEEL